MKFCCILWRMRAEVPVERSRSLFNFWKAKKSRGFSGFGVVYNHCVIASDAETKDALFPRFFSKIFAILQEFLRITANIKDALETATGFEG